MFSATVTVKNRTGLHARPASQLVMLSQKFESQITIISPDVDEEIDPKSIISLLSGGVKMGTTIEVKAEGSDEESAVTEIVALIESFTE